MTECKEGKFDAVSVIFRTFHSVQLTGRFDEELVGILPESLKFICHNGMSQISERLFKEVSRFILRNTKERIFFHFDLNHTDLLLVYFCHF